MKKIWAILAGLMILPSVWATTYTYTGPNYAANTITNYTPPCNFGSCGDYLTSMNITGTFTTAAPLAPNLANATITSDVTNFSFSDGLTTFDSTATNKIRIVRHLKASTNAQGQVTAFTVLLRQWRVDAVTHAFGDFYDELWLTGYAGDIVYYNNRCNAVGPDLSGQGTGVADSCNGDTTESESYASSAAGSVTSDMPFTIGGTVSGLATGDTVILKNNGADDTPVASNTTFTFTTGLVNGAAYAVTVGTPPAGKTCTVTNGTGTVSSANVTNVAVACTVATPASIPTLSEWGMIFLSSLIAMFGIAKVRRRNG